MTATTVASSLARSASRWLHRHPRARLVVVDRRAGGVDAGALRRFARVAVPHVAVLG